MGWINYVNNLRVSFRGKKCCQSLFDLRIDFTCQNAQQIYRTCSNDKITYCDFRIFRSQQITTHKVPLLVVQEQEKEFMRKFAQMVFNGRAIKLGALGETSNPGSNAGNAKYLFIIIVFMFLFQFIMCISVYLCL